MKDFDLSVLIKESEYFSTRTSNTLKRISVRTLQDLVEYDRHHGYQQLKEVEGLGLMTFLEIEQFFGDFIADQIERGFLPIETVKLFLDHEGVRRKDIPLDRMDLPGPVYKRLKRLGYDYGSQLIGISWEEFLAMESLGRKSVRYTLQGLENAEFPQVMERPSYKSLACQDFTTRAAPVFNVTSDKLDQLLLPLFEEIEKQGQVVRSEDIYTSPYLRDLVKHKVLKFLRPFDFGVELGDVLTLLPTSIMEEKILLNIMNELEREKKITINGTVQLKRMTLLEYLETLYGRWERILSWSIKGLTMHEIGQEYGVSVDRVSQLLKRELKRKPLLKEDRYLEIYQTYNLSCEDFCYIFKETEGVYNYLKMFRKRRGKLDISKLAAHEKLPVSIRRRVENLTIEKS